MTLATQTCKGQADVERCGLSHLFIVYVSVYVPTSCEVKPIEILHTVIGAAINQPLSDSTRKQFAAQRVLGKQNILTRQNVWRSVNLSSD